MSPYDYLSITHYNSYSLQKKNGQSTMLSKIPALYAKSNKIEMDRDTVSNIDVFQVQSAYNCKLIPVPEYEVDEFRLLSFKRSLSERLIKEAKFRGVSDDVIEKYLEKTFTVCGLDHYWPIDYPIVESNHLHYRFVCKTKKEPNQKCKYSIECEDDAYCVRPFFTSTGICVRTGNEKIDLIGQAINDEMFESGKKVKDTAKKTGTFIKENSKKVKDKIENVFKDIFG